MANKTELIRDNMARTRESLRQKLDTLEDRTLGVVRETTETVAHVAEQVTDTVESARRAVKKTVKKSVRAFDLTRHVEEHPWAIMGGAVATGFLASWLVSRASDAARDGRGRFYEMYPGQQPYAGTPYPAATYPAGIERTEEQESKPSGPNWLTSLAQTFAPQLDSLKQLAIGAAIATVRDTAMRSVPGVWTGELAKVFDGVAEKLGGTTLPEEPVPSTAYSTGGETRPRWENTRGTNEPGSNQPRANEPHKTGKKRPHGNGRHSETAR
jgi:ElaB/YqjD/DUF883 family membrane-anchored ribosome-binding protein